MIKIVILDQSKLISLILKIVKSKIQKSKIQKSWNFEIAFLLFIKMELRQVYNPF